MLRPVKKVYHVRKYFLFSSKTLHLVLDLGIGEERADLNNVWYNTIDTYIYEYALIMTHADTYV